MTNPGMLGLVKIGYSNDPEKRRKDLSRPSGIPADFVLYATYAVPVELADKKVHSLITTLNPSLKFSPNREYFKMDPEDAYKILEALAAIHGRMDKLFKYIDGEPIKMYTDKVIDEKKEPESKPVVNKTIVSLAFDSDILSEGGKKATNYLKETLIKSDYISSDWKLTHAKLNKDGKRFWANPTEDYIQFDWCLVLNDVYKKVLYIFKIPANSLSIDQMKIRIHQGKRLLDLEIVYKNEIFVCMASKVNFTKWHVETCEY